jgi:hypothetical protein
MNPFCHQRKAMGIGDDNHEMVNECWDIFEEKSR